MRSKTSPEITDTTFSDPIAVFSPHGEGSDEQSIGLEIHVREHAAGR